MNSIAKTRSMKLEWQKLVTPLTPKSVVATWQNRDSEIQTRLRQAAGAKKEIEPIDWEYWKKTISAPGVVEQMQKEYEALNFQKVEPYNEENNATIANIEAEILQAKKDAVHGANEAVEAEKVVAQVKKLKAEGLHWNLEEWYNFMPGLKEQHIAEYDNEDYLVSDEVEKLDNIDWKLAAKEYVETGDTDLGEGDITQIADQSLAEEIALKKAGKWSISRMFASKEERAQIQARVEESLKAV